MTGEVPARRGPVFWISAAFGWAVIGWGVRGALHHHLDTRPTELVQFLAAGAAVHDLVLAPLVLLAGVALGRMAPRRWRPYLQGALMVSGVLVLFSFAEVRGYARVLHNPTSLPHNYSANLILVILGVMVATAAVALVTALGQRRHARRH